MRDGVYNLSVMICSVARCNSNFHKRSRGYIESAEDVLMVLLLICSLFGMFLIHMVFHLVALDFVSKGCVALSCV